MAVSSVFHLVLLFAASSLQVAGQGSGILCRRCNLAATLDDCTSMVQCASGEECYMDELITDQLTIIYNSGCRAKQVCDHGSSGRPSAIGKKRELVACSKCCNTTDDCNKKLCGIKSLSRNVSQCYSCTGLNDPTKCVTFTTCQTNEVCSASLNVVGGVGKYSFGCMSKTICRLLMQRVIAEKRLCEINAGTCSTHHRRAGVELCNVCCGDGGCNYGSCDDLADRFYNLYKQNLFNLTSLTQSGAPSGR